MSFSAAVRRYGERTNEGAHVPGSLPAVTRIGRGRVPRITRGGFAPVAGQGIENWALASWQAGPHAGPFG